MSQRTRSRNVRDSSNPTRDMMVKVAIQVSLSMAKVFLHTPSRNFIRELAKSGIFPGLSEVEDNATIAETLLSQLSQSLADGDMTAEDRLMLTEALVAVMQLLTKFTKPMIGLPSHDLFHAFKAYILMHQICAPAPYGSNRSTKQPNHKEIVALRRYMRFSMSSYGMKGLRLLGFFPLLRKAVWSNDQAIQYLTGLDPEKALIAHRWRTKIVGELYRPGYLLLVDKTHREVVLCVRGSYRLNDVLTDLVCDSVPFTLQHADYPQGLFEGDEEEDLLPDQWSDSQSEGRSDELDDEAILRSLGFEEDPEHVPELQEVVTKLGEALQELAESSALAYPADGPLPADEAPPADQSATRELGHVVGQWVSAQQQSVARALFKSARSLARTSRRRAKEDIQAAEVLRSRSQVHRGFLRSSKALSDELLDTVTSTLDSNPGFRLVLCGHSLGGAVASTLALLWRERPEPCFAGMRCYTYAPPCSVSLELAAHPATHRLIRSVVYGDDVIPRLSIMACQDVRDAVIRMATSLAPCAPGESFPEMGTQDEPGEGGLLCDFVLGHVQDYRDAVAGASPGSEAHQAALDRARIALDPVLDQLRVLDMQREKLYPPGTVWHVDPSSPHGVHGGAYLTPNQVFGELNLNEKMAAHHLQQKYAHACDPTLPLRPKVPGDVDLL